MRADACFAVRTALVLGGLLAIEVDGLDAQADDRTQTVEIRLVGATVPSNGPGRPWDTVGESSLPDCYAVVEVDGEIVLVTRVAPNTLRPRWSEVGTFQTRRFDERILVRVYDDDEAERLGIVADAASGWGELQTLSAGSTDPASLAERMARDDLVAEAKFPLNADDAHARTSILIRLEDARGRVLGRVDAEIRPVGKD